MINRFAGIYDKLFYMTKFSDAKRGFIGIKVKRGNFANGLCRACLLIVEERAIPVKTLLILVEKVAYFLASDRNIDFRMLGKHRV